MSVLSVPAIEHPQAEAFGHFPTAELVSAAASLFAREVYPERPIRVAPEGAFNRDGSVRPGFAKSVELYGWERAGAREDRLLVEGPRWFVEIGPGLVAVRSADPARRQRALEREVQARSVAVAGEVERLEQGLGPAPKGVGRIRSWSAKSRSKMIRRLAGFDYSPFLEGGEVPAMITLTYPGEWLAVVPSSTQARRHVEALRKRYEREWRRPLVAIWKREFQRRGAPHYHLLMVPPVGEVNGERFPEWLSRSWAEVVDHPDPVQRWRHRQAGTGVDYAEGARALDPRRLGIYFAKHGSFAAKEYQNDAPREWLHQPDCEAYVTGTGCDGCATEGVGRFWGYWRLRPSVVGVEVAPDVAQAVVRAARRAARSRRYYARRKVWRKKHTIDHSTGEVRSWRWVRRTVQVPVLRMRGRAGYLVVNDGPALASQLAVVARQATSTRRTGPSGAGPLGFLP